MTVLRHILAIVLLPLAVTVVIPLFLLNTEGGLDTGWSLPAPWAWLGLALGALLIGAGLWLVVQTVALFIRVGRGTLAPWDPPRAFVVRGVYRHVRNPMLSGILAILLGEALLAGSFLLLFWFVLAAVINAVYIPLLEEPELERRFGGDYRRYKQNVPRWIPRRTPWEPSNDPRA